MTQLGVRATFSSGAAVFYVFTTAMHTGLLDSILTFTDRTFYPAYLGPAQVSGTDPLADQQLAGLVMWIPAGVILTLLGLGFFAAWIGAAKDDSVRELPN